MAAFAVVLYHVGTAVGVSWLAPNGDLAVDFFFALSGFVIAHAYGARLTSRALRPLPFLWLRVLRLWPIALLGSLLGLAVVVGTPAGSAVRNSPGFTTVSALNLFLVPNALPGALGLYPLNPPHWSLFYELAGNFVYAVAAQAATGFGLLFVVLSSGFTIVFETIRSVGTNVHPVARLSYAFAGGLLAYRLWSLRYRPRLDLLPLLGLIGMALLMPANLHTTWRGTGVALAMVSFPLVVWMGASSCVSGRSAKLAEAAGEMSYPLYAVHYPLVLLATEHVDGISPPVIAACAVVGTVALSGACLAIARWYDQPVRVALRHWRRDADNRVPRTGPAKPASAALDIGRAIGISRDFADDDASRVPLFHQPGVGGRRPRAPSAYALYAQRDESVGSMLDSFR